MEAKGLLRRSWRGEHFVHCFCNLNASIAKHADPNEIRHRSGLLVAERE